VNDVPDRRAQEAEPARRGWEQLGRVQALMSQHGYWAALATVALATAIFFPGRSHVAQSQWGVLYLLVVMLVAAAGGVGPAVLAAVLAFLAWNFFFILPYYTLEVAARKDWLELVAFLAVAVAVGILGGRLRDREERGGGPGAPARASARARSSIA
jgi:two-component system sensor histidine kinase KdpD